MNLVYRGRCIASFLNQVRKAHIPVTFPLYEINWWLLRVIYGLSGITVKITLKSHQLIDKRSLTAQERATKVICHSLIVRLNSYR